MVLGVYCAGGFGGVVMAMAHDINSHELRWSHLCFISDDIVDNTNNEDENLNYSEFKNLYHSQRSER